MTTRKEKGSEEGRVYAGKDGNTQVVPRERGGGLVHDRFSQGSMTQRSLRTTGFVE